MAAQPNGMFTRGDRRRNFRRGSCHNVHMGKLSWNHVNQLEDTFVKFLGLTISGIYLTFLSIYADRRRDIVALKFTRGNYRADFRPV
jgi:hypothetical protein